MRCLSLTEREAFGGKLGVVGDGGGDNEELKRRDVLVGWGVVRRRRDTGRMGARAALGASEKRRGMGRRTMAERRKALF